MVRTTARKGWKRPYCDFNEEKKKNLAHLERAKEFFFFVPYSTYGCVETMHKKN